MRGHMEEKNESVQKDGKILYSKNIQAQISFANII